MVPRLDPRLDPFRDPCLDPFRDPFFDPFEFVAEVGLLDTVFRLSIYPPRIFDDIYIRILYFFVGDGQ